MDRRSMLTAFGGSLAVTAGCSRLPVGRPMMPTETTAAFGTAVRLGEATLTLSNPRVQKGILADFGIWQDLYCDDGQYLLVSATTDGAVASRFPDLDLRAVTDSRPTGEDVVLVVEGRPGDAPRAPPQWSDRLVGFHFPDDDLAGAAIEWHADGSTATWPLDDALRDQLRIEPRFELEAFEAGRDGDDGRVRLHARNSGDRAGRFIAQVSHDRVEDDSTAVYLRVGTDQTTAYHDVPRVLRGVARDGLVVTLRYTAVDSVGAAERVL